MPMARTISGWAASWSVSMAVVALTAPSWAPWPTARGCAGGNQRLGILALGAFFVIGLGLLARVEGGGPTGRAAEARAATGVA